LAVGQVHCRQSAAIDPVLGPAASSRVGIDSGGIVANSRIAEFFYARGRVVDELHAEGKDDAEIARTLSINADEVLMIRTRERLDDIDD
jgi:hypothetical protein